MTCPGQARSSLVSHGLIIHSHSSTSLARYIASVGGYFIIRELFNCFGVAGYDVRPHPAGHGHTALPFFCRFFASVFQRVSIARTPPVASLAESSHTVSCAERFRPDKGVESARRAPIGTPKENYVELIPLYEDFTS